MVFTSFLIAILVAATSVACYPGSGAPLSGLETRQVQQSSGCGKAPTASGTKSVTVNGKSRQYIVRVPQNYDKDRPYRLIFGFHWVGGTMNDVAGGGTDKEKWSYYGMQRVGNESNILVAPQGISNGWGNSGGEDIAFTDAMVKAVESELCVNQKQRFSIGFSYGGSMSYSIACSRAKEFRGVAVISGGVLSGCSGGNDPIAYMGIHGISDGTLNIAGGRGLRDKFVANNGCTKMSPKEPSAGSKSHVKTDYQGCTAGYPVSWIAFDGGHYPGAVDGQGESGAKSYVPGEIFSFFSQLT